MEKVMAYLNYGRWIVDCPKHGKNGALEVTRETTEYIAPCCYPGSIATFTGVIKGILRNVPDVSARATARNLAVQNNEIFEVVFPEDVEAVLSAVSIRMIQNQNWTADETVEFLHSENVEFLQVDNAEPLPAENAEQEVT